MTTPVAVLAGVLGAALLGLGTYDTLRTTLAPAAGGGPVTRRLSSALWRAARRSSRPDGALLASAGTVILLLTVAVWVVLLWAGWTLVFAADSDGIVSRSGSPATPVDLVYFTGFTLFTLGVGDFVPATAGWKLITPLVSLHGLFSVTLAITYLLPVMSAAVERRRQAAAVWGMGGNAVAIVQTAWYHGSLDSLQSDLKALTPALLTTVERHPTYPVLHYFHTTSPRTAFPARVAALDEAVTVLLCAVHPDARPALGALLPIRRAVDDLLATAGRAGRPDREDVPPVPDLSPLAQAGIPLLDREHVSEAYDRSAPRRRRLHEFVAQDGWPWSAVVDGPDADTG
ncbi:MAG: potassium channel family protein [Actinomycetota bacterium]|nr:potassium channel family protein [Actinomycetota bacterium]